MNLNRLRIFYSTAKYGGVTAAAHALFITQPAVTKGLQQFEEDCGTKLFDRFGKKMVLTDAGDVLYEIAEKVFQLEHQAEEVVNDFRAGKVGHIRIDACESFGAYYLPDIITEFAMVHPWIRLLVNIWPSSQVAKNTLNFDNDLGIISSPVDHELLKVAEILEDKLVMITPPDHPLAQKSVVHPNELNGLAMIRHERESGTRIITDKFCERHGLKVSHPLELSNNEAIKKAVSAGLGTSIISRNIARQDADMGRIGSVEIADPELKRKYYLVHHKDKYISKHFASLIQLTKDWSAGYMESEK